MLGGLKRMIRGWLDIQEAPNTTITINEKLNFDTNCIKNEIWMRGDPVELEQFYKQIYNQDAMFWGAVPYIKIRKIHVGIPSLMVKVLSAIVVRDMNDIKLKSRQNEWEKIEKDNKFKKLLKRAISKSLYLGDGAFKISFDTSLSQYPIIEFYGANKVELIYERGRFKECIFKTKYTYKNKNYILRETYGFGYIKNKLVELPTEKEVKLDTIPQTRKLMDFKFAGYDEDSDGNIISKGNFCMAIPFMVYESSKWENRGRSVFDGKEGAFDALDEAFSQWMDALRGSRPTKYIPKSLLPRDPETGYVLNPNEFDNRFIANESDMSENGKNEIKVTQPAIPSSNYLESYITALDACLQGIISPSTLGIDVKKLDNAEAQREKEKTTLYTRNDIIESLQECLPLLVNNVLKALDVYNQKSIGTDIEVTIDFGEYANPSFEAVVETVSKAKTGGLMSIEAAVDELYGDTKDDDWKAVEVKRLKEEQGITEIEEPSIANIDVGGINDDNIN
ncbi:capsid protein [Thomasclavelia spiroformis]|uniref:capsid protein n=1 Tax=Thomasclavelia spiroformis TaxID=29348 RepID=UPI0026DD1290|nr:capsid protein [Thomasclavelia spiroformis]